MPRYTFVFATNPPPRIMVTVPAATAEEARVKAEAKARRVGKLQTLGPLLYSWEEPPSPEVWEVPSS
jgi:hypothetical protein